MRTDLFLRDLRDDLQKTYISDWKRENNIKMIEAYKEGKDIKIGEYLEDGAEEMVD